MIYIPLKQKEEAKFSMFNLISKANTMYSILFYSPVRLTINDKRVSV